MKKKSLFLIASAITFSFGAIAQQHRHAKASEPNVIIIMTDDLGYGDLSCYGSAKLKTPNVDALAASGIRFTNGHSTSSTCTPSRYALMTGKYPWRKQGTGILPGDAALIVPTDKASLPKVFKQAGYETGIVGKWHLGLGNAVAKDWNGEVKPGPNDVGFDYSFIFPATADRVPTVFLEDHKVVALDPKDTIAVSYTHKIGNDPTGKENPELLKLKATPGGGHDGTIVNGIGRIGFMSGGKLARWVDEEVSSTFLAKAEDFITQNRHRPFFLYFAMTEPHVPRMPATRFKGKSGLGLRGDVILQMDWTVGELMKQLKALNLSKNTIVIFTSDNGPVLNDGYLDEAVEKYNGHTPAGPMRGGKYSTLEGGTRLPFIVSWPGKIKPGVSDAFVSQLDLLASFASFTGQHIGIKDTLDSENHIDALLGRSARGRTSYIEQGGMLAIVKDGWKYIPPHPGVARMKIVDIETGNADGPQLYNLNTDIGEKNNLAAQYPEKIKALDALLKSYQKQ